NINLDFTVGAGIENMAISNTEDFSGSSQEAYQPFKQWNFCWMSSTNQTPQDCSAGTKAVFVKFYTAYGVPSATVSMSIEYKPNANVVTNVSLPPLLPNNNPISFFRTLSLSSRGVDVRALQIFLNTHGFS